MSLAKPLRNMHRGGAGAVEAPFIEAQETPEGRTHLAAYRTILRDVQRAFEFIEPRVENGATFSHRTYELLLRCCTEVETNFKAIGRANGHAWNNENILRYSDLDVPMRLSQYEVASVGFDYPIFKPFASFADANRRNRSPPWYRAYNAVKHDRATAFNHASLENVIHAFGGLYVLLRGQYGPFEKQYMRMEHEGYSGSHYDFELLRCEKTPIWLLTDPESYNFDWATLRGGAAPWDQHPIPPR